MNHNFQPVFHKSVQPVNGFRKENLNIQKRIVTFVSLIVYEFYLFVPCKVTTHEYL